MIKCVWSIDGMVLTRENWSTQRTTVLMTLCPWQFPHELTQDQTWASDLRG